MRFSSELYFSVNNFLLFRSFKRIFFSTMPSLHAVSLSSNIARNTSGSGVVPPALLDEKRFQSFIRMQFPCVELLQPINCQILTSLQSDDHFQSFSGCAGQYLVFGK
uniref:Uncharacterized protein n=1 Tax=Ditylenchus dipsaci TaxID=166011 RepID=A0A915D3V5_9BILA